MLVIHPVPGSDRSAGGFLGSVFGRPGLVLHGETAVKQRQEIVRRFQEDEAVGFFVLSLKPAAPDSTLLPPRTWCTSTGGGNPAVENQATDRAFRIGQTKNVWCINSCAAVPWKIKSTSSSSRSGSSRRPAGRRRRPAAHGDEGRGLTPNW